MILERIFRFKAQAGHRPASVAVTSPSPKSGSDAPVALLQTLVKPTPDPATQSSPAPHGDESSRPTGATLRIGARSVPLLLVQHPRARRYLLRLRPDGTVRVTIPRRGTMAAARDFANRNIAWLEQQFRRLAARPQTPTVWAPGTEILFRGEPVRIQAEADGVIRFGPEQMRTSADAADLRPAIQKHLHQLAALELPPRVLELAALHGISLSRVSVRNQKTRWGSCSRRGTISLNWRLIQSPAFVRDYIILHELAHRRQMNHSEKFWQEVARLCPDYQPAERWLKQHAALLR